MTTNAGRMRWISVSLSFALVMCDSRSADPKDPFLPFDAFLESVRTATPDAFMNRPDARVQSRDEFERMRAHVLTMYDGVKVGNSFILGDDSYVDCVDVNTQPGLRRGSVRMPVATPPKPMVPRDSAADQTQQGQGVPPMLGAEKKDRYGNVQFCRAGFIPMRRIRFEEMVRHETLEHFFNKYGRAGEKGLPRTE